MFKLEHGEKDVSKAKTAAPVIDRLHDHRERWRDDYAANRLLRDQFRVCVETVITVDPTSIPITVVTGGCANFRRLNPR